MPPPSHSDVTVIVRECGERTADACASLLEEVFPGQVVFRVSGQPFAATLEKSLLQGLAEARPWTLCVDADVLVLPSLTDFIDEAKRLPDHYVEAQALVADKLLPARRPAGNHLYRTALIPKALTCLPKTASLRPESSMMDILAQAGHPYHQSDILVGLHDFEQYPADIYNKAALHGHKHAYLEDLLLPLWLQWGHEDLDYRIAYDAFVAARQSPPPAAVSRNWPDNRPPTTWPPVPALGHMSARDLQSMLLCAPYLRPEAAALRKRIENDVAQLITHQRRLYALSLTAWQRRWRRLLGQYPYPLCAN